jgi:hypothetical protein
MQASKILPGHIYAVKAEGDRLARFKVAAIVTRRERATGSPHDYTSRIEGVTIDGARISHLQSLKPEEILGPFDQYAELAEQKRAEDIERKRHQDEREAAAAHAVDLLYTRTGIERPADIDRYGAPFRRSHSGEIALSETGVRALIEMLDFDRERE